MESALSGALRYRAATLWLFLCSGLVFAMVLLGGSVRLTGSGLSMVEWKPLMGIFPPIGSAAWEEVFASYQEYPEYQLINRGMTLSSFQFIYYMEYLHRILGRLIGLVFALPFIYWWLRRKLPSWIIPQLWIVFGLGACQGLLGWYMVVSGLVDDPRVSQYRLTAHLMMAILIYAWLVTLAFRLQGQDSLSVVPPYRQGRLYRESGWVIVLIFIMMVTGGFMAGTKAGFIFNTWPMMGNQWMPDQTWAIEPWWRNLTDNPLGIQFVHRWLAFVVLVAVSAFGLSVIGRHADRVTNRLGVALIAMVLLQVGLGIATLLYRVPLALGIVHQGGALVLLTLLLALRSRFRHRVLDTRWMTSDQGSGLMPKPNSH